jgi:hypothetical protein
MLDDPRRELLEKRQHLVTYTNTQKARIHIRWILCAGKIVALHVRDDVTATRSDQWADDVARLLHLDRRHRSRGKHRQTSRPRTSHKPHQHRFGSIVRRVTRRYHRRTNTIGRVLQSQVPRISSSRLQIGSGRYIDPRDLERYVDLRAQLGHQLKLASRFHSQSMIDPMRDDSMPERLTKQREHMQ